MTQSLKLARNRLTGGRSSFRRMARFEMFWNENGTASSGSGCGWVSGLAVGGGDELPAPCAGWMSSVSEFMLGVVLR